MTPPEESDDDAAYSGVFGAVPFAIRASDSTLFRLYGLLGSLAATFVGLLFGLAIVVLVGRTAGVGGGSFTLSRAFFFVVGLFAVGPMLAPILYVARRHRRGDPVHPRYDAAMGAAGFAFAAALYVGLVISTPVADQEPGVGPVVTALYGLPRVVGILPPLLAALAIVGVDRVLAGDRWAEDSGRGRAGSGGDSDGRVGSDSGADRDVAGER